MSADCAIKATNRALRHRLGTISTEQLDTARDALLRLCSTCPAGGRCDALAELGSLLTAVLANRRLSVAQLSAVQRSAAESTRPTA